MSTPVIAPERAEWEPQPPPLELEEEDGGLSRKPSFHEPMPTKIPTQLFTVCNRALNVLDIFTTLAGRSEKRVPGCFLRFCHGVILIQAYKTAVLGSVELGRGILVAKTPQNKWSAPVLIGMTRFGVGFQVGVNTQYLMMLVLNKDIITSFLQGHKRLSFGLDFELTTGPYSAEGKMEWPVPFSDLFVYSSTEGLMAGISFDGGSMYIRESATLRCYGKRHTVAELLTHSIYSDALSLPEPVLFAAERFMVSLEQATLDEPTDETDIAVLRRYIRSNHIQARMTGLRLESEEVKQPPEEKVMGDESKDKDAKPMEASVSMTEPSDVDGQLSEALKSAAAIAEAKSGVEHREVPNTERHN